MKLKTFHIPNFKITIFPEAIVEKSPECKHSPYVGSKVSTLKQIDEEKSPLQLQA